VPEEIDRWRRGAQGERATAVLLRGVESLGWPVLHDRSLPGTAANVDHLVVGPGGVFHLDSKHWSGPLVWDGEQLWRGRLPLGAATATADWESTRVRDALTPLLPAGWIVPVHTVVVVHGAVVPFGAITAAAPGPEHSPVNIVGSDVLSGWIDQQAQIFTAAQRAMIAALLEQAAPPTPPATPDRRPSLAVVEDRTEVEDGQGEQPRARVQVPGRGEAHRVVPVDEGGADRHRTPVPAAGVDVPGTGPTVPAQGHRVAQVRRLRPRVQMIRVDPHAPGLVALVLRGGVRPQLVGHQQREPVRRQRAARPVLGPADGWHRPTASSPAGRAYERRTG